MNRDFEMLDTHWFAGEFRPTWTTGSSAPQAGTFPRAIAYTPPESVGEIVIADGDYYGVWIELEERVN